MLVSAMPTRFDDGTFAEGTRFSHESLFVNASALTQTSPSPIRIFVDGV